MLTSRYAATLHARAPFDSDTEETASFTVWLNVKLFQSLHTLRHSVHGNLCRVVARVCCTLFVRYANIPTPYSSTCVQKLGIFHAGLYLVSFPSSPHVGRK